MIEANFIAACTSGRSLIPASLPEVAVAGRSNCGKSSLINALTARKKLARTSSTPGRTRELIFFRVALPGAPPFHLVDLPGYGYAKVSRALRGQWGQFVTAYVQRREALELVLLLLDLRRTPGDEERDLLGWLLEQGRFVLPVATKADKVAKNRRFAAAEKLARALDLPRHPLLCSVNERSSIHTLRRQIVHHLQSDEPPKEPASRAT